MSQDQKERMPEQVFPLFLSCAVASAAEAGSGSFPSGGKLFPIDEESTEDPSQETWLFLAV